MIINSIIIRSIFDCSNILNGVEETERLFAKGVDEVREQTINLWIQDYIVQRDPISLLDQLNILGTKK